MLPKNISLCDHYTGDTTKINKLNELYAKKLKYILGFTKPVGITNYNICMTLYIIALQKDCGKKNPLIACA